MFKLSTHAKRRLYQRYGVNPNKPFDIKAEVLNAAGCSYWVVFNGQTDGLAIIKNGVIVTLLHMHHKLSNKIFGL